MTRCDQHHSPSVMSQTAKTKQHRSKSTGNMASVLSDEQLRCVICQDIFNNPVSIPCGHNFCLRCIKHYWRIGKKTDCPLCKEMFTHCPDLRVNVALKDITEHFKRFRKKTQRSEKKPPIKKEASVEEVLCDVCTKEKAEKTCLVCFMSYCSTHLEPHQIDPNMKDHKLMDAATAHLCPIHYQQLSMFCRKDQTVICGRCSEREHKHHEVVSVETESIRLKTQMKKSQAEVKHLVIARGKKAEEIKVSLETAKQNKEQELQKSLQMYETVKEALERRQVLLVEEIEEDHEEVEKRAEELQWHVSYELEHLQRRRRKLQGLQELQEQEGAENNLKVVQGFVRLPALPPLKDWSEVKLLPSSYIGTIRSSLTKLVSICRDLEKELTAEEITKSSQYAVDVTLDPVTAAAWLVLSPDGKKVGVGSQQKKVPDDPRRFDSCVSVLGKQSFTAGKHYWVVQVADKTDWDLGVARESINRKGAITVRPDMGYWAICRRKGSSLSACAGPSVTLHLQEIPQKVGIFLDYDEGLVSFYDTDAKTHIYTYSSCHFTEPLYPYLNPCLLDNGKNMAPLVICAVSAEASEDIAVL